jgi:outer membrane receptor protein involved in Fe transport
MAFEEILLCNYSMIRRAVSAVLGLLGCCLPLAAQQSDFETISVEQLRKTGTLDAAAAVTLDRPDLFNTVDSVLLLHSLPVTTLLDGRRFPISGETGHGFDLFPIAFLSAVDVHKDVSPVLATDAPGGAINLRLNRFSSGGELGVFYGKSDGKYGSDLFQTYIIGGVGNDKFNITAGAMYEESNGHELRLQR